MPGSDVSEKRRAISVRNIYNRQRNARDPAEEQLQLVAEISLPNVDGIPGKNIIHNFCGKKVHCIQTFQWTCGMPITWGKCYTAESLSRVYKLMEEYWEGKDRPGFMFYDNACGLLKHLITSHPNSPWRQTTRFLVDTFHYTSH
ncbi:hypothetical protein M422DRAFT_258529 [Sphaerobolus stellatus SS14]|uniref:Uncharacterized protein n=1 Tax=Sphaerobolus stellatus (strain SS14) TaxID=990650 RepID=A0A0C9UUW2_SPHS4|nr:hypothetical protein M422DRAFT_258529 [Sphaerobolus stellatus SS14]